MYIFRQLGNRNDYKEIAQLIYKTDPYIYPDLFGNIETAMEVLPYSFEDKRSLFFKDYVYHVKNEKNEVVGIAFYHDKGFVWKTEEMFASFEKANVETPDTFACAAAYMEQIYSTTRVGGSMCNISIREDYRNKGVGSFLLEHMLKIIEDSLIELTILQDNLAAYKLYAKFGFEIVGEPFADYGGCGKPAVGCYKMILNRSEL